MNSDSKPSSSAWAANLRIWSPCCRSLPGSRYDGRKTPSFKAQRLYGGLRMAESVRLPRADGEVYDYTPSGRFLYAEGGQPPRSRLAYGGAHGGGDPRADVSPASPAVIDWDRTLAFRRHI